MNRWTFTGRLGADAEKRMTAAGKSLATFRVAVTAGYGDRQSTIWAKCVLFGKRAEGRLVDHLVKGAQVAISGELSENVWTTKEGEQRKDIQVRVDDLDLIGGKAKAQQSAPQAEPQGEAFADDIPFAPLEKNQVV